MNRGVLLHRQIAYGETSQTPSLAGGEQRSQGDSRPDSASVKNSPPFNPESRDRLKLDERWNFALPGPELPANFTAKVPAKETSAGPAVQCHSW